MNTEAHGIIFYNYKKKKEQPKCVTVGGGYIKYIHTAIKNILKNI